VLEITLEKTFRQQVIRTIRINHRSRCPWHTSLISAGVWIINTDPSMRSHTESYFHPSDITVTSNPKSKSLKTRTLTLHPNIKEVQIQLNLPIQRPMRDLKKSTYRKLQAYNKPYDPYQKSREFYSGRALRFFFFLRPRVCHFW